MNYPRGYPGMFGAVLTEPTDPDADVGAFFLTNTGYLDMCVHSALGLAVACLETGMLSPSSENKPIKLETPAGIVSLSPAFSGNDLVSMAIEPGPAYVHTEKLSLDVGLAAPIEASIVFSAVFFVLVDVGKIGMQVDTADTEALRELACKAIKAANFVLEKSTGGQAQGPSAALAFLYENADAASCKSAVFSPAGVLDRSPCGAGTVAKVTLLHQQGDLGQDKNYVNANMFGTQFTGRVLRSQRVGENTNVWSRVSGSAHVTGFHNFVVDPHDGLHSGT